MSAEETDWILDINLREHPLHLAREAAQHLATTAQWEGSWSSWAPLPGLLGVADEVVYCAAKAGLRGLAESLRAEWRDGGAGRRHDRSHGHPGKPRPRGHAVFHDPQPPLPAFVAQSHPCRDRGLRDRAPPSDSSGEGRRRTGMVGISARLNGGVPSLYAPYRGSRSRCNRTAPQLPTATAALRGPGLDRCDDLYDRYRGRCRSRSCRHRWEDKTTRRTLLRFIVRGCRRACRHLRRPVARVVQAPPPRSNDGPICRAFQHGPG